MSDIQVPAGTGRPCAKPAGEISPVYGKVDTNYMLGSIKRSNLLWRIR
jgi:hypothetical protein